MHSRSAAGTSCTCLPSCWPDLRLGTLTHLLAPWSRDDVAGERGSPRGHRQPLLPAGRRRPGLDQPKQVGSRQGWWGMDSVMSGLLTRAVMVDEQDRGAAALDLRGGRAAGLGLRGRPRLPRRGEGGGGARPSLTHAPATSTCCPPRLSWSGSEAVYAPHRSCVVWWQAAGSTGRITLDVIQNFVEATIEGGQGPFAWRNHK